MTSASKPLAWALGLAVGLAAPSSALAGSSDLTPCRGEWRGTAVDPWNPNDPYLVELRITGGTEQCATVKYVNLCTSRWVDCEVSGDWVTATEVLVDPGDCVPTKVTLQCVDPDTVAVKFEAEIGVMETTLHRLKVDPPVPSVAPPIPAKPSAPRPSPSEAGGGCGCSFAWVVVLPLGWRRRARNSRRLVSASHRRSSVNRFRRRARKQTFPP